MDYPFGMRLGIDGMWHNRFRHQFRLILNHGIGVELKFWKRQRVLSQFRLLWQWLILRHRQSKRYHTEWIQFFRHILDTRQFRQRLYTSRQFRWFRHRHIRQQLRHSQPQRQLILRLRQFTSTLIRITGGVLCLRVISRCSTLPGFISMMTDIHRAPSPEVHPAVHLLPAPEDNACDQVRLHIPTVRPKYSRPDDRAR